MADLTTLDLVLATVRDLPAIWWVGVAGLILWLWNLIEAKADRWLSTQRVSPSTLAWMAREERKL